MDNTIQTAMCYTFDFAEPEKHAVHIEDIAHALSHLCRFTGHTKQFYSVAQHSVLVSRLVPEEHALYGLLHDAAEAYIGDVAKPLKIMLPDYCAIEKRVEAHVLRSFHLDPDNPPTCVKLADLRALEMEMYYLMTPYRAARPDDEIVPVEPFPARSLFLRRFTELTGKAVRL